MSDTTVKPGQVWADNDPRARGRTLQVVRVYEDSRGELLAVCEILTMRTIDAERLKRGDPTVRDMVGRETRIAVKRMRPNRTGYVLVSDGPRGGAQ